MGVRNFCFCSSVPNTTSGCGTPIDWCADSVEEIVIAYEPVWAIGTGRTATPDIARKMHAGIRERLIERYSDAGTRVRIQYGGSVKPSNVVELMAQPDIDGALVGGASLTAENFVGIVKGARSAT